jgi:hypothetical protein
MEFMITFFRRNEFFFYLFLTSSSFNKKLNDISSDFTFSSKKEFSLFDNFMNQMNSFVFRLNNLIGQYNYNHRCYLFYNNTE